jgi:hypothetical protein
LLAQLAPPASPVAAAASATTPGAAVAPSAGRAQPTPAAVAPVELKSVRHFRQAWKRLNAEQRLAQSRAALPQNAGPLNSQHLVHKALQQMRQLSPAYFERFVAQVDGLMWLEQALGEAAAREPASGRPGAEPPGRAGQSCRGRRLAAISSSRASMARIRASCSSCGAAVPLPAWAWR